ncbi:hypothetical protein BJX61DRAFT_550407 [Aspergillus egyptiacus]|nr:hypothetical protein BJX61DRAFT_550407 [Aspergillus egyptiacus]
MQRPTLYLHLLALIATSIYITPSLAQCPSPTASLTVSWPDSRWTHREILVSRVDSNPSDDTTTYHGVDCINNPHYLTIAFGPFTFSEEVPDSTKVCSIRGSSMDCTTTNHGLVQGTTTSSYDSDMIGTVTMAVVSSGAENPPPPLLTDPPYWGCPEDWLQCGDTPWCCPTSATICTTAPNFHEACASVPNEEFPGPALPYYATAAAGPFAARPTHLLVGGLAGVGLVLL